jgi:hypothetical protein
MSRKRGDIRCGRGLNREALCGLCLVLWVVVLGCTEGEAPSELQRSEQALSADAARGHRDAGHDAPGQADEGVDDTLQGEDFISSDDPPHGPDASPHRQLVPARVVSLEREAFCSTESQRQEPPRARSQRATEEAIALAPPWSLDARSWPQPFNQAQGEALAEEALAEEALDTSPLAQGEALSDLGALLEDYRAAGCAASDEAAEEPPCADHPYRLALETSLLARSVPQTP